MNISLPKEHLIAPLSLLIIFAHVIGACGSGRVESDPTSTRVELEASATATVKPTRIVIQTTPTPTTIVITNPAAAPDPTALSSGDVIFELDINDLTNWFPIVLGSAGETAFQVTPEEDGIYFEVSEVETTGVYLYLQDFNSPIQIDAVVETVAGPNRNNISLICFSTEESSFELSMQSSGIWQIWQFVTGEGYSLVRQGTSAAINLMQAKNELTAICTDRVLRLIINGEEAVFIPLEEIPRMGAVGLSVSTFDIPGVGVRLESFTVRVP